MEELQWPCRLPSVAPLTADPERAFDAKLRDGEQLLFCPQDSSRVSRHADSVTELQPSAEQLPLAIAQG